MAAPAAAHTGLDSTRAAPLPGKQRGPAFLVIRDLAIVQRMGLTANTRTLAA